MSTLLPYTTLSRSGRRLGVGRSGARPSAFSFGSPKPVSPALGRQPRLVVEVLGRGRRGGVWVGCLRWWSQMPVSRGMTRAWNGLSVCSVSGLGRSISEPSPDPVDIRTEELWHDTLPLVVGAANRLPPAWPCVHRG